MDQNNKKVLTVCYGIAALLTGFVLNTILTLLSAAFGVVARLTQSDLVAHGLPVAIGVGLFFYLQFSPKVNAWADDVVMEIRKVVFRTHTETAQLTLVVCVLLLIVGMFLSVIDLASTKIVNYLLTL